MKANGSCLELFVGRGRDQSLYSMLNLLLYWNFKILGYKEKYCKTWFDFLFNHYNCNDETDSIFCECFLKKFCENSYWLMIMWLNNHLVTFTFLHLNKLVYLILFLHLKITILSHFFTDIDSICYFLNLMMLNKL